MTTQKSRSATTDVERVLESVGVKASHKAKVSPEAGGRASRLGNYGVVFFLVVLVVGFSIAQPARFPTLTNAQTMLSDMAIPAMLALAVTLPLSVGEFDLSVGATLGFNSILVAYLTSHGTPVLIAVLAALVTGCLIGAVNALLVVGIGVNAFIATLGTATVLAGLNLLVSGGATIFEGIPGSLKSIAQTEVAGLTLPVFYCAAIAVLLWYLLEHTPYGRFLRATGLGREAARLSGVSTRRMLASSFVVAGALAGLCGMLQTARIGSATASTGPEFLLPAYAAAFLGSTTIKRGKFNVWGTVVGVLLLSVGITGLTFAGAPFWIPNVFNGTALILAVSITVLVTRRTADRR
ncbi:ABC transporter permease [Streptomyces sp. NPDC047061]|uniref:ABC transporter permease n=1 Tax=Streptomyces sp. NPDC047061 TaxID=3154605 RepID=UPI0033E06346